MKKIIIFIFISVLLFDSCSSPVETLQMNPKIEEPPVEIVEEPIEEPPVEEPEPEPEPEPDKLTLMIYMAADNDLESYSLENLKAMERSEYEKINVLVLLDRAEGYDQTDDDWTDTRLFEVKHDDSNGSYLVSERLDCAALGLSTRKATELDLANPNVLKKFIEFGKSEYEAEKYALIIWGHGTGWRYAAEQSVVAADDGDEEPVSESRAFAIDDKTGTYMSVRALGQAVRNQGLCVIGFDTCFGGVMESVYELKDCAAYTVGCPGVTPSSGWNYRRFLEALNEEELSGRSIAEAMKNSSPIQTSVFVNEKIEDLFNSFESFSHVLADTINSTVSQGNVLNTLVSCRSYSYTQNPCDIYLDVFSMADSFTQSTREELASAAADLKSKVRLAVLVGQNEEARIGVHFIPKSASGAMAGTHSLDYVKDDNRTDQCAFIKESLWWVPTPGENSGSLLDKLFYASF